MLLRSKRKLETREPRMKKKRESDLNLAIKTLSNPDLSVLTQIADILCMSPDAVLDADLSLLVSSLVTIFNSSLSPDLLFMSCRCFINLFEINNFHISLVIQHNLVPALILKLLDIQYVDLGEQIFSVLLKISLDYPASIIKANGLIAVLQYIDFFSSHVQRNAIQIAAHSCRGLNSISLNSPTFTSIIEIMPILERLVLYDDKVGDECIVCLDRIIEWVCNEKCHEKVHGVVSTSLLSVFTF